MTFQERIATERQRKDREPSLIESFPTVTRSNVLTSY